MAAAHAMAAAAQAMAAAAQPTAAHAMPCVLMLSPASSVAGAVSRLSALPQQVPASCIPANVPRATLWGGYDGSVSARLWACPGTVRGSGNLVVAAMTAAT
jgi:hypothetical protein